MEITVNDLRRAVSYVNRGNGLCDFNGISDEEFLNYDFSNDLKMGNIRVINVVEELQRIHDIDFPPEELRKVEDGTIRTFMNIVNDFLSKKAG